MISDLVITFLVESAGYKNVPQPLHIADVNFDFAGALIGPGDQQILTLILDEDPSQIPAALRRLKAFTVVLDRAGSTRPINVVLITSTPDTGMVRAMEQVARVIIVHPDQPFQESLSTLIPLQLPSPIRATESAEAAFDAEMPSPRSHLAERLLKAARKSSTDVESEMRAALLESVRSTP